MSCFSIVGFKFVFFLRFFALCGFSDERDNRNWRGILLNFNWRSFPSARYKSIAWWLICRERKGPVMPLSYKRSKKERTKGESRFLSAFVMVVIPVKRKRYMTWHEKEKERDKLRREEEVVSEERKASRKDKPHNSTFPVAIFSV